jgi:ABC-type transport system substrate-binding protein
MALAVSFAAGIALVVAGAAQPHDAREGGTFRIGLYASVVESIDPFLNNLPGMQGVFDATCASLLHRRDEPLPAASELVPELAEHVLEVSDRGKAYTFRVRRGYHFSTGEVVTARDVAATVRRALKLKGSYKASDFRDAIASTAGRARTMSTASTSRSSPTTPPSWTTSSRARPTMRGCGRSR